MSIGGPDPGIPDSDGDSDGIIVWISQTASESWSTLKGVPSVLRNLTPEAKALLSDPRTYILVVVYEALVGGFINAVAGILSPIFDAAFLIVDAIGIATSTVAMPFNLVLESLGGLLDGLVAVLIPVLEGLGPAAPFVAVLIMYYGYQFALEGTEWALTALWPAVGEIFALATSWLPGRGD